MKNFKVKTAKNHLKKLWSLRVRERDNYKCQWCLSEGKVNVNKRHHGHHIVSKGVCGNAGRYEIDNGVTLCYMHHLYRLKDDVDGYIKFRDVFLRLKKLDYFQMRDDYRECIIKFTEEFYNQKLIGLGAPG